MARWQGDKDVMSPVIIINIRRYLSLGLVGWFIIRLFLVFSLFVWRHRTCVENLQTGVRDKVASIDVVQAPARINGILNAEIIPNGMDGEPG